MLRREDQPIAHRRLGTGTRWRQRRAVKLREGHTGQMLAVAEASSVPLSEAVEASSWVAANGYLVVLVKASETTAAEVVFIAVDAIIAGRRRVLVYLECFLLRRKSTPMPSGLATDNLPSPRI